MLLLTTKLTPSNPTQEQAKVFRLLLIALEAARHLDAAPLALDTDVDGIAVSVCNGHLSLYETTTKVESLRGDGEEVPAWGIARLVHYRGDREEPPSDDYEDICVRRGLGEAVSALACEVVRESIDAALEGEAERQTVEDWTDVEAFEFEHEREGDGEIDYHGSDLAFDAARERRIFGQRRF